MWPSLFLLLFCRKILLGNKFFKNFHRSHNNEMVSREIIENLRRLIRGQEPKEMIPWFKNFKVLLNYNISFLKYRYLIKVKVIIL